MKINNLPIQIDALKLCYKAFNPNIFSDLLTINSNETINYGKFTVVKLRGKYYTSVLAVCIMVANEKRSVATITFSRFPAKDGSPQLFITPRNPTLYDNMYKVIQCVAHTLELSLGNITTLDICQDSTHSIVNTVKSMFANDMYTPKINGKIITDRKEYRKEIKYIYSGTLDNPRKYLTVYVEQADGATLKFYNKKAEIENYSDKTYILRKYGNPKTLYRTEVHLLQEDIADFEKVSGTKVDPFKLDEKTLENIFYYKIENILQFKVGKENVDWRVLLQKTE